MTLTFFIFLSLLLSAFFSGSEIAFVSANKLKIELKKRQRERRGAILARFFDRPADFLGTMLVGNNIALVIFTTLMTLVLTPYLESVTTNGLLLLLLNTLMITLVVLLFGEFLPKTLFRLYAEDVLFFLAYPLRFMEFLLLPPAWLMTSASRGLLRLVTQEPAPTAENTFTRLDLQHFIRETEGGESENDIDRELFGKVLDLKGTRVRDCMVPRPEMETIDWNASVAELENLFRDTKLSRIVVVDGDIDKVKGYVHHQQLLHEPRDIKGLILQLNYVTEAMAVTQLLNTFIQQRRSIACVVDEYGGVSGLITLEDILEEIFGEIEDEHDEGEYLEKQLSEDEYIFSGRLEISYLNEQHPNLNLPEGDYHTLSGYLVNTTETIPEQGAEIILPPYKFILDLVSDTKIETIRMVRLKPEEDSPEDNPGA